MKYYFFLLTFCMFFVSLNNYKYPRLAISKYKVAAFHSITLVLNKDLSQDTAGLFGATPEQL